MIFSDVYNEFLQASVWLVTIVQICLFHILKLKKKYTAYNEYEYWVNEKSNSTGETYQLQQHGLAYIELQHKIIEWLIKPVDYVPTLGIPKNKTPNG